MSGCQHNECRWAPYNKTCIALLFLAVTAAGETRVPPASKATAGSGGAAVYTSTTTLTGASPLLIGAQIGHIEIVNSNIFDLDNPDENKSLYRLANTLHIKTRSYVIENQLLFETGELFEPQKLEESERLLRRNRYIGEAVVVPVKLENGVVDIEVRTTDDWTLKPSLSFGRGGGQNSTAIGLEEYNLFGRGSHIGIEFKSDVDRDSTTLQYSDNNLFGSRFQILAGYSNNSDGYDRQFALAKPFYALGSLRAGGISLQNGRRIETLYDRGNEVAEYDHSFSHHEAFVGWSTGLKQKWTRRWISGVTIDEHTFGPIGIDPMSMQALPDARRYVYPFVGIELLEDDFVKARNIDQIGRVEDRHLGANLAVKLGYSSAQFGSTADAMHLHAHFGNSIRPSKQSTLLFSGALRGRLEAGEARNVLLSLSTRYDLRQSQKRLFHARLTGNVGKNLDIDNPLYLGGDNGLRGYPLRYLAGDKSVLLTVEQRLFTDWYPFRLFRIGGAAFFDVARTWGQSPAGGENLGWLRDVGLGLRIGNSRSSVGRVLHVDLAFPLDGNADISNVQLQIEAKRSF